MTKLLTFEALFNVSWFFTWFAAVEHPAYFNAMFDCGCYMVSGISYYANQFCWLSGGPACYPKHLDHIHSIVVEKFFLHFVFLYALMNIYNYKTGFRFDFWQSVSCVDRSVHDLRRSSDILLWFGLRVG